MKERMDKADEARLRNYITKYYTSAGFGIFDGKDPKIGLIKNLFDEHLSGNDDRLVSEEFEKNIKERKKESIKMEIVTRHWRLSTEKGGNK
jgi:hypothetical protein